MSLIYVHVCIASTLARVERYAVLTITWMCHLHVSMDFNQTSWVHRQALHISNKVRCTYMPALPSSLACVHVNRPYAVSLNISSHLLQDGMFKSTSCAQTALSTFTTKFLSTMIVYIPSTFQQIHVYIIVNPGPIRSVTWPVVLRTRVHVHQSF